MMSGRGIITMFESIINFFKKTKKSEEKPANSKSAAKERLHLVLMQDRANVSADFLELMKQEIIEVIKKYIEVDESAIDVRLTNKENEDGTNGAPALYANIPIVNIKNDARKIEYKKEDSKKEIKDDKENKTEKVNETKQNETKANEEKQDENKTSETTAINEKEVKASESDKSKANENEKNKKDEKAEIKEDVKKENNNEEKTKEETVKNK